MQERERFAGLKYRVDKQYSRPLDEVFPQLFQHQEFKMLKVRSSTWPTIVRYIAMLYDKESNLLHEHPSDLRARKEAAAVEAGFTRDAKGQFSQECQDIMDVKLKDVHEAIMRYLKIQKHYVWQDIVVTEQELDDFMSLRFRPIDTGEKKKTRRRKKDANGEEPVPEESTLGKKKETDIYQAAGKKDELLDACDKRRKHLETLYKEFYGDNKDVEKAEFSEMIQPETAERIMKDAAPAYMVVNTTEDVLS